MSNEFIKIIEVIPIHTERYNRQISRLLAVQDYSKEDLQRKVVDKREYYRAREERIRAYNDCINTMIQKERILQYHTSGFQLEVIEERTEIRQAKDPFDITKLAFDEMVELLHLMQKSKQDQNHIAPIAISPNSSAIEQEQEAKQLDEPANVTFIQHEDPPESLDVSLPFKIDPVFRLKENLNKIAANRFKEVGGNLDEEEQGLIQQ